ncbi:hypothetical protein HDE_08406 [Halotydeus destructor]|nr:hypothetical protein HDE_08406 [Halotydeus destructor]
MNTQDGSLPKTSSMDKEDMPDPHKVGRIVLAVITAFSLYLTCLLLAALVCVTPYIVLNNFFAGVGIFIAGSMGIAFFGSINYAGFHGAYHEHYLCLVIYASFHFVDSLVSLVAVACNSTLGAGVFAFVFTNLTFTALPAYLAHRIKNRTNYVNTV